MIHSYRRNATLYGGPLRKSLLGPCVWHPLQGGGANGARTAQDPSERTTAQRSHLYVLRFRIGQPCDSYRTRARENVSPRVSATRHHFKVHPPPSSPSPSLRIKPSPVYHPARQGKARQNKPRHGKPRHGKTRHGMTRRYETRPDTARQDKTREDSTRQHKTSHEAPPSLFFRSVVVAARHL
jgi:hypothetical protein